MIDKLAVIMLGIGALVGLYYLLSVFIEYKIFEETKNLQDSVDKLIIQKYAQRQEIDGLIMGCSTNRAMLKDAQRQIRKIKKGGKNDSSEWSN